MKWALLLLLACFLAVPTLANTADKLPKPTGSTTPVGWCDDYNAAVNYAKKHNRAVLVLFTGSDWCGWCVRLRRDVLDTPEFMNYAKKNLVLVYVDFPRNKAALPQELARSNNALKQMLGHSGGVPATVLLDSNGKIMAKKSGYSQEYLRWVKSEVKKSQKK